MGYEDRGAWDWEGVPAPEYDPAPLLKLTRGEASMSDFDERGHRIPDDDELREAIDARRRRSWLFGPCRCGFEMPGTCPGPANCPLQEQLPDNQS